MLRAPASGLVVGMPAYVVSEVEILDASSRRGSRELAEAAIARHGGRYIVRGAKHIRCSAAGTGQGSSSWRRAARWLCSTVLSVSSIASW